ncbi:DUF1775 domain-containing protein [Aquihabitans daechungensis]|uniref:DUF1775 domain-containing protein n=1 Tax=Aquihabitans daechungensis TaxID=1052257 RepID=UPI003B9E7413
MTRSHLRLPVAIATAVGVALCMAGPASAHIHTDPEEVKAGTENTVGFIIEHGCDGSPTTKIELQLPNGATGISGVDGNGFLASVEGQVVTFEGGTLPDDTEQAFEVTFTAPSEAGTLDVPLVQTCEEGSTDWIESEVEGQPEPEYPAPQLVIAPNADATTTTAADSSTTTTATEAGPTTTAAPAESTTTAPAATVVDDEEDDDDSSTTPLIIGAVVVILAAIGGAAYYLRSKQGPGGEAAAGPVDDGPDPGAPTAPPA